MSVAAHPYEISNLDAIDSGGAGSDRPPQYQFVLAETLDRIGIRTAADVGHIGAESVWMRLCAAGLGHDIHALFAMEGAIRGIRWHALPSPRRHELRQLVSAELEQPSGLSGVVAQCIFEITALNPRPVVVSHFLPAAIGCF